MAKSVEQIILELEIREGNLNERIVRLNKTIDNAKKGSQDYERALKKLQLAEIQLAETSAKLTNAQKRVGVAHQQNIKNLDQTKDATGATTSSVLELGRVISDAPYGIRGMANNLTQLVSQLAFSTKEAGSFAAALRQMWTAMMGPLGIVVAITAVISAFDWLYGANKKAEKSTSDFRQEVEELADLLNTRLNVSIEEYIKLVDEKKRLDDDIAKSGERVSKIEERLIEIAEERAYWEKVKSGEIESGGRSMSAIVGNLNNLSREENQLIYEKKNLYTEGADSLNEYNEKLRELKGLNKEILKTGSKSGDVGSVMWYEMLISQAEKRRDKEATTSEEYKKQTEWIDKLKKELADLRGEQKEKKRSNNKVDRPNRI